MVEIRLLRRRRQRRHGHRARTHTGELFVRSPAVFADYYKQHDKFEADSRDGFQTVGDIAYRDDEGFFYICDRKKDMIISGGMNIYPAEIEAALEAHPDIYEAAVFGIPSEEWGETRARRRRRARRAPTLDDDDVIALRPRAPRRLQGAALDLVRSTSCRKTGSGKILKRELRAPVLGRPRRRRSADRRSKLSACCVDLGAAIRHARSRSHPGPSVDL